MNFLWFWTFWHWARESFHQGSVLRGPLHGIGGHWDEWFQHEAAEHELRAIADVGKTDPDQRAFVAWLTTTWAQEIESRENRCVSSFVLGQLAHLPPFDRWETLSSYRIGYGMAGVSAVVLAERSAGEPTDVRPVEAILLPPDPDSTAPRVIAESFRADPADLEAPRCAALNLFGGSGFLILLAIWALTGRRSYPRWLRVALALGWWIAAALLLRLLFGPEPGHRLVSLSGGLLGLAAGLGLVGVLHLAWHAWRAWLASRLLRRELAEGQVRLRMPGRLVIQGGSAGLAFALNMVLAALRSSSARCESWIWKQFTAQVETGQPPWTATGVVTSLGRVRPVILEPKLRACLQHVGVAHVLIPVQRGSGRTALGRVAGTPAPAEAESAAGTRGLVQTHLGFAAEPFRLRVSRCLHLAQAVIAISRAGSRWQTAVSVLALAVLATTALGFSDLRALLVPPPPPLVVGPGSPSPYYLWVSIDSTDARHFRAVFESEFWSNRRADFEVVDGNHASVRAEILLRRLTRQTNSDAEHGVVWIERRRRFLSREYTPGDRVGRYDFSYVSRLKYE